MATFTFLAAPTFPEGTALKAYLQRDFAGQPPQPGQVPRTTLAATSSAVDAQGYAAFTGLDSDTGYYAGAQIASEWRWKGFRTAPATAASALLPNEVEEVEDLIAASGGGAIGPRTAVALSAKVSAFTIALTVRSEATNCRLEGNVKATSEVKAGETIATIPEGFRPIHSIAFWGDVNGSTALMQISTAGLLSSTSAVGPGLVVTTPEGVTWALS